MKAWLLRIETSDLRKTTAILAIVFLIYCLMLSLASYTGFPDSLRTHRPFPYLADKPVGEDGYYMLTIAWSLASGDGLVYNFDEATTGIQPLGTFIYGAIAWLVQLFDGSKWTFIRLVLTFGAASLLVFAHLIGVLVTMLADEEFGSDNFAYALAFAATAFNFGLYRWFTYGLETGIYVTFLAICILYTMRFPRIGHVGPVESVVFGILAALVGLTRIDFGLILLIFLVLGLIRGHLNVLWVVSSGMVTMILMSPWFAYVYNVSGTWLPSSGTAQAALISSETAAARASVMATAILNHLTPWIYPGASRLLVLAALFSLVAFTSYVLRTRSTLTSVIAILNRHNTFTNWSVAVLILVPTYLLFFWAGHFYGRYIVPIVIPSTVLVVLSLYQIAKHWRRALQVSMLYAFAICFFAWAFLSLHTGRIGNSHTISAGYLQDHYTSAKVGAFQSGVIGYFNANVVNLDGKVNHSALKYAEQHQLHNYVDQIQISVLIDWPGYISLLDESWLSTNWQSCPNQIASGSSVCFVRK